MLAKTMDASNAAGQIYLEITLLKLKKEWMSEVELSIRIPLPELERSVRITFIKIYSISGLEISVRITFHKNL